MVKKESPSKNEQIVYGSHPEIDEEYSIDFLMHWNLLWSKKYFIIGFTFICALISVYWTLFVLPETYKSTAVLQSIDVSSGSAISKLSGLASSLPIPINIPGVKGKDQNIMAFLNSRTLKKRLLTKYDLLPRLYSDIWDAENRVWVVDSPEEKPSAVKVIQSGALDAYFEVSQDNVSELITVVWIDEEPEFAAKMLRNIIKETPFYFENEYETDTQNELEFIEKQLNKTRKELQYWESKLPSKTLTMAEINRERLANQTVYAELRKQLELAKIAEAKDVIRFKVLDEPFIPEMRFKPNRTMICAITIILSGFVAIILVYIKQFIGNIRQRSQTD